MSALRENPARVIIIDDSLAMQQFIKKIIAQDDELVVVGVASDPFEARDLIKETNPDVLILDIEMPRMDGLTFLENLMRLRPLPVVMNSSLSQRGTDETIKALELGAFDYIGKPQSSEDMSTYQNKLIDKVKRAAKVKMTRAIDHQRDVIKIAADVKDKSQLKQLTHLIGLGASTGGVEALSIVLRRFPSASPPVLIVQHIPPKFSASFAERLNENCEMSVCEANHNQKIQAGFAYIAPGGMQMTVVKKGNDFIIQVKDGDDVSGHKPSVDALFSSLADLQGIKLAAALMTGMGSDGAVGLKAMFDSGAYTAVQDENTSIVWGMPRSAIELESQHTILPLSDIPHHLFMACGRVK